MRGRTVILVSHHVQLCAPGASYIVALDNGRVQFQGDRDAFQSSGVMDGLVQSGAADADAADDRDEAVIETLPIITEKDKMTADDGSSGSETSSTIVPITPSKVKAEKKAPRKLVEEEKRAVGRIGRDIWETYIWATGAGWYWTIFGGILILASLSPVLENGWLKWVSLVFASYWR